MIRKAIYLRYVLGYFVAVMIFSSITIWFAKHFMPHSIYLFWLCVGGPTMIYGASMSVKLALKKHDPEWGRPVARVFAFSLVIYAVVAFAEAEMPNSVTALFERQKQTDIELAHTLNPAEREALAKKYCVRTPEGIKVLDDRVPDPVYGIQAEPCTLDQIVEMRRAVHPELGPQRVQVVDARTFAFFEPVTGHPRIWYHKTSSGDYEFFDRMGNDPATGEPLRVIDQQTREDAIRLQDQRASALQQAEQQRLEQERLTTKRQTEEQRMARIQADNERRASYLLVKSLPSRVEFVVSAETAAKLPMDSLAAAIAKKLKGKGKTASSFVFSSSFITSGEFDSFFDGRGGSDLQNMQVSAMGNNILLARITTNFVRRGATAVGLISASIVGSFRVISAHDGSVVDGFEIEAVGAGTSDDDAKSAALDHILEKLSQHGY
jgi:hypothetical protein